MRPAWRVRGFFVLILLCIPAFVAARGEEKQISVYTPQTSYSLPVVAENGSTYVGLAELLEPLGTIDARLEGRKWKLRFASKFQAQFTVGSAKAKIGKRQLELPAPFEAANGRGLVPVYSLPAILRELLPGHTLVFHEHSRRLFLDKAQLHYTAEIGSNASGRLVLTFSAPVNPFIATEPGRMRMVFRREPLLPGTAGNTMTFSDSVIPSLSYDEANGEAELTVHGTAPLIASFSNDRKTITITTPQSPVAQASPQPGIANRAGATSSATIAPAAPVVVKPPAPKFLVVIDPAHGGADRGAAITDKLAEKDVTLAFAERLSQELQSRGIASRLLRNDDSALSLDQRSVMANAAMPSLFLTLHASASGEGVHLFTSPLASAPAAKPTAFLPWDTAQATYVRTSRDMAHAVATELLKHDIPAMELPVSVRPLNSVAAPAIAIEIDPRNGDPEELNSAAYQQSISSAIAAAIVSERAKLPHGGAAQ